MKKIILNIIPILIMIGLISIIENDYLLTFLYIIIISISLFVFKCKKNEIKVMAFGFIIMILFESIFISTGVEVFIRNSLFGIMPIWLPFLWSYGFFAIKRSINFFQ